VTERTGVQPVAANKGRQARICGHDVLLWCEGTTENTIFYGKSKCARQPYKPSLCQAQTVSTTEPCIIEGRA